MMLPNPFWAALLSLALLASDGAHGLPIARTANGPVSGTFRWPSFGDSQVATFWSIPYAEPPVGQLRFRAPQPLKTTWNWPYNARTLKIDNMCPQIRVLGSLELGNEDCLFLNVHTPAASLLPGAPPRPVMVWIFGGGFTLGDGNEFGIYDGKNLAGHHDVVVVTMNYRVGILGFMAHEANMEEDGTTGNQGVLDQQLALKWVRDNIVNFGGDPNRVTLFGESAGAFSVMWHLVAPGSRGLYHQAIMESGTSQVSWFFQPYDVSKKYVRAQAEAFGCPDALGSRGQLDCLRKLDVTKFQVSLLDMVGSGVERHMEIRPGYEPAFIPPLWPIMPNAPAIDGRALPDVPMKMVERGDFAHVPLIIGSNENGGTLFEPLIWIVAPDLDWPAQFQPHSIERALDFMLANKTRVDRVLEVYPEAEFESAVLPQDQRLSRIIRDLIFMCPNRDVATSFANAGQNVWLYNFHANLGLLDKVTHFGDFHAAELPFVFKTYLPLIELAAPGAEVELTSDVVSCHWTTYAHSATGNPNSYLDAAPHCAERKRLDTPWPRFNPNTTREGYVLQAHPTTFQVRKNNKFPDDEFPRDQKCDMWHEYSATFPWNQSSKASLANRVKRATEALGRQAAERRSRLESLGALWKPQDAAGEESLVV